jgi:hypothetical protein
MTRTMMVEERTERLDWTRFDLRIKRNWGMPDDVMTVFVKSTDVQPSWVVGGWVTVSIIADEVVS